MRSRPAARRAFTFSSRSTTRRSTTWRRRPVRSPRAPRLSIQALRPLRSSWLTAAARCSSIPPEQVERPSPRRTAHDYARIHRCPFHLTGPISTRISPADFTVHTALDALDRRVSWADSMPAPQRVPSDLIEQGRTIPVARVTATHEGKRARDAPTRADSRRWRCSNAAPQRPCHGYRAELRHRRHRLVKGSANVRETVGSAWRAG